MADVQKAKGALQIANHLFEAMIEAEFNAPQLRIVMTLIRLTYGWNARSVRMKESDLAKLSGGASIGASRAGGAWRVALDRLIENGVVVRLETDRRGIFLWGINKDFETWKHYSSTLSKLGSVWSVKPDNRREDGRRIKEKVDAIREQEGKLIRSRDDDADEETEDDSPSIEGTESGPVSGPASSPVAEEGIQNEWTDDGPQTGPMAVHINGAKSLFGETLQSPKDRKDSNTVVSTDPLTIQATSVVPEKAPAAADAELPTAERYEAIRQYSIGLATAANAAIERRWGPQPNVLHFAKASQLAAELLDAGVPLELARHSIASVCASSKNERPPVTPSYFRPAILEAARDAEQRELNAQDTPKSQRGGPPARIVATPSPAVVAFQTDAQLRSEWSKARHEAALAWSEANEREMSLIVATVEADYRQFGDVERLRRTITAAAIDRCAERSGFPTFEAWRAQSLVAKTGTEQEPTESAPNVGVTVPSE